MYCFGQSIPGCYNYVAQTPITATSNSTISGYSINCNGAATPGITIPAGVHDVHITKCKILNSTTSNGLIYINSGCYNITIDTCFLQSGYRGIYAVGATNNIHIWYNFFYNIIDPNVTATSTDGGGSSVQLNGCTGTSIQVLDNRSFHDVSSAGVGDQFSLYKCSGTVASPIRICRNQAFNGSTNPPGTGYAGAVAGDLGGGYQRVDSNIFVNVGAVGAQIQGGHDIEMSYNTIFLAQATYTSVGMAFGNYSGTSSTNITMSYNNVRCIQPSGSIFNYWFDSKTAFQPTGWSTNTTSTGLNANILPNPLWSACTLTVLPPNIVYSPSSYTFTMGTAITPFTPSNSGSLAAFTATLPPGLTINPSTGTISGTPTIGSPPANYTVTAINTAGSSTATINIGVISTDASLSSFVLSNGTLSPVFCGCTSNYTASVANSISSVTITPTVNQVNATVTVNGIPVTSGTTSGAINLAVGTNVINTVVTAQSGSTNTYSVTIIRAPATDATLSSLVVNGANLSPPFSSGITSYTDTVNVASINLTPTVNQPNATVTVNGVAVASGQSIPVNLVLGVNTITTVVTAQDGITTNTYTLTITRLPSPDATLSSLTFSGGTLSPVFNSSSYSYTSSVGSTISSVTFTPVANQANATITVNGVPVSSGGTSNPINLAIGTNIITVIVTAQDGSTTQTYTVTITRGADATLSSLTTSSGTLSPSFDSNTTSYTMSVDNSISSITLTPVANDPNATVTVNGSPVTLGNSSNPINLVVGDNTISTVVTGQDGVTKKTYTVTVTRQPATDATLASLGINNGTLTPSFDSGTTSYTVSVDNSISSITLTPSVNDANASVTVNGLPVLSGNASNPVNLLVGNNTITVVVTAQDGTTKKTYTITATRAKAANIISFNALAPATYGNSPITLTASSNNTDAGASIIYSSDNQSVATVSGNIVTIVGAGTANITASEAATANFNAAQNVTQTLTVNQANLTITAKDQHKIYGSLFTFNGTEFTTSGLVTGDAVSSVTLQSDGSAALANVGTYPITPSAATGNGLTNYTITYAPGTFTVNGVTLTFAAIPDPVYGTPDFDPGATSGSSISYTSSDPTVATIVNGNIHIVGVGTSTITATAVNVIQTQTLTVTPAPLTITAKDASKTYGTSLTSGNPSNAFNASGLQSNETIDNVTINYGSGADAGAAVGTYPGSVTPINATGATFNPNNYSINYVPGNIIVGKTALTITANNGTKVYGTTQTFAGTEFIATGLINGDGIDGVTLTSAGAPASASANNYPIIPSAPVPSQGTDLSNYTVQLVNGNDAVGQALLTITADNQSMIYGSVMPALTVNYSGFVNNETPESLTHLPLATTTATSGPAVGVYPITVSGAIDNNYTFTYVGGTLSVTQADLTIAANNLSKIQGHANPALTLTYTGFVNGDTKNNLTTQPTVTTTATTDSPEGDYPITVDNAVDANYNISYTPGTLTVSGLALTFGPLPTQTYGDADFDPGADSSSPITYTSSNTSVATISNGYVHIVGAGSTTITANDGKTSIDQGLTVSPAPLTVSADNQTKTYGADNPPLTISYSGFVNSESAASLNTLPTISTNADNNSIVGSYTITVNGAADPNYSITYTNGTLTVTRAPLKITANNQNRMYGNPNPPLTVSYDGFMNSETALNLNTQPAVSTTADINSPPANYPITASGAVDANYSMTYVPGTMTVNAIPITFNPISSQAYGSGDFSAGASGGTITYTSSNLNVATIVSGNIHIVGAGSTTITANNGSTSAQQTLTITPVPLTITANGQSKIYGAVNPTLTVGYSGFVNSDGPGNLTTPPSINTVAASAAVGTYPITASGAASPNYTISYVAGTLTINQASLTIKPNDQAKVQGTVNPTLTVNYSGFVNGETSAALTTPPTVSTTAITSSPIGTYPITASGAVDANYMISYTPGTLTVNAPALTFNPISSTAYGTADFSPGATSTSSITYTSSNPAVATIVSGNIHIVGAGTSTITANDGTTSLQQTLTVTPVALTITAANKSKTYGVVNPTLSVTYSGFVNNETSSVLSTQPTIATTAVTGSSVGTYPITVSGAAANNYTISYVAGTLTVNQAALTITAANKSKIYGAVNPTLTATYSGFVNGDTQTSLTTQPTIATTAATGSSAGTYPITASGAVNSNYSISYVAGTLTIGQAALTITANNQSKTYGSVNPTLTVGYSGFVNGDSQSNLTTQPTIATTALTGSAVGTYPITASGAVNANYSISYVAGILTVGQAALTITANNQTKSQGAANPTLTVSYSGFVNSETNTALTAQPTVSTTATSSSPVGTYPITASGAVDGNYSISYVAGTLTVSGMALSFGPIPSKVYGTADFSPGASSSSPITYSSSNTSVATIVSGNIHIVGVGTSTITANDGSTSLQQTLTVTAATLSITANSVNKTYGSTLTGGTGSTAFTSSGLVNGETIGSVTITYGTGSAATVAVGTYSGSVTPSAATGGTFKAGNYTITYNSNSIVVTAAPLTITASNRTKTYGTVITGGTGSTAFTSSGLVNGQTIGSVTMAYGTGASATTAIGTYTSQITPSAATGGTFSASNYSITYNKGNITVSAAALTITASNVTKTYGATLTGGTGSTAFTSSGLANGQTIGSVTIAYGTGSAATTAAGSYTGSVTPSAATGGTFTASNYTITYNKGNITVNKAALTITANNQTKTQGVANPTLTVSYSGFVNSETNTVLTTQPTVTTTATTSSPAGTYPITASGAAAANYTISYVAGTLTVTAANTLTFNAIPSKVYGVANFSPGATTTTGTITYTSSNTSVATIVSGNIHIVGVGTSTITANNGTSSKQQTLTVTKASLTITGGVTKTYGSSLTSGTGSTAFTSSGLAYSQTIGSVTMTYGTGSAATAAVGTYTGTATPSAATGGTFVAANYTITYVAGNITVSKATLTITAAGVTKNYGTAITGRTGSTAFTSSGLKNSQTIGTVTIAYGTGATATSKAGSYSGSVTPSAATGGTFIAADYTITYVTGSITVSKVPLKITANNQTKIQGKVNPTLTVSYSGFVNGETNSALTTQPTITTTATTSSPVGTYPITASGAVDANYTITYVAGTLTINPSTAALVSVVNPLHETYVPVDEPSVRPALSPNGDGINDVLHIDNIESYPDNKVTLMNRNGNTIFEITGYDNQNKVFDGHSNITKEMQRPGTYFYVLEYKVNGELKRKTSYFVIKY